MIRIKFEQTAPDTVTVSFTKEELQDLFATFGDAESVAEYIQKCYYDVIDTMSMEVNNEQIWRRD